MIEISEVCLALLLEFIKMRHEACWGVGQAMAKLPTSLVEEREDTDTVLVAWSLDPKYL